MAGVLIYVDGNRIIYKAWCEFYPNKPYIFDLDISPGDEITINVTAITTTCGVVTVCNLTTSQEDDHKLDSTSPLCQSDAVWLIYRANNPLVNFGTLAYTNATAYGTPGTYPWDLPPRAQRCHHC
ncbi:peptidase G1 [Boletus edulis BED1]|uniref:Peptidase G1 n=1 Tax=Boletus edulis BED1 TaxID=1328754 RepID=A0AAD4BY93_BOLED|nr:peptidase G1 [Boletus edulis BED1]